MAAKSSLKNGDSMISVAAPKLRNNLPLNITQSDSVSVFKSSLKTYLFKKQVIKIAKRHRALLYMALYKYIIIIIIIIIIHNFFKLQQKKASIYLLIYLLTYLLTYLPN